MTPITRRRWLEALAQASAVTPEKVPDGWLNSRQLGELWDVTFHHSGKAAKILARKGKFETRKFLIPCGSGRIRSVVHYHLK